MMAKLKKKNRYVIFKSRDFWLVILVLIYGFYSGLFGDLFNYSINGWGSLNSARIEIDYGIKRRAFEGDVLLDMSILDALLAASRGGDFEIRYVLLRDKTDIMKINGLSEDGLNGKRWLFYLNGEEIRADEIHKIKVKPGDKILAEFK
ncbi:MAG: hypothetical protein AAB584_02235 [Patescibacteria group bacterium]